MKAQTPLDFLIVGIKVTNAKDIHCKISEEPSSKSSAIHIKICGGIVALCKDIDRGTPNDTYLTDCSL